jgi:hypothetical protein
MRHWTGADFLWLEQINRNVVFCQSSFEVCSFSLITPSALMFCTQLQHYLGVIRDSTQAALGGALINFARTVPDGLLVFFSSYGVISANQLRVWVSQEQYTSRTILSWTCKYYIIDVW